MTTMFIQLRRVVYLLVLLQCCVCAVCATKVSGGGQDSSTIMSDKADVDGLLNKAVEKAIERIGSMAGCLDALVGEGETESFEDNSKRAEAVAKSMEVLLEEVGNLKEKGKPKWEPEVEWKEKKKTILQQKVQEFHHVRSSLEEVYLLVHLCRKPLRNLDEVMEGLADARKNFLKVHENKKDRTPEVMKLDKNSSVVNRTLFDLSERFKPEDGELKPLMDLVEVMMDTVKAVKDLKKSLESVPELVTVLEGIKEEDLQKIEETKENNVIKKLEEAKADARKEFLSMVERRSIEGKEENGIEEQSPRDKEERKEDEEQAPTKVVETKENGDGKAEGIKEEDGEGAKNADEKAEEKKEEDGERAKNADEKSEEKKEEDGERAKNADEKSEEKKEEDGERAKNADEKSEEKKEEDGERAKNADEKAEKEENTEQGRAESKRPEINGGQVISVIQGVDSSSGPSLVHSPLMLLLLCVLGCTLVC
ncbi:uncharacterized protein TM35_000331580 [Trypanosoma theileri]|uniref:Uncharacterized protein n=1 Tax=Trypanosoma theileri TaxID=67003 RepID=A0A1X0NM97_9TRYP|nr:uncharacterized protein TM35_000331580 [Trypanosoma theileri]ORC85701.1 hypothetical protein TM35_000331580 [Trypanosoma theileri]